HARPESRSSHAEWRTMAGQATFDGPSSLHVSLMALPDAVVSTLAGIFDVLNGAGLMGLGGAEVEPPFRIEIVGEAAGALRLASGVPFEVQKSIAEIEETDIVIVPSVLLRREGWIRERYPTLVNWVQRMHDGG